MGNVRHVGIGATIAQERANMPIMLSQTYEIATEESAHDGELAESGYDWENAPHTFRETVELIRDGGFIHPSDSQGAPRWLTSEVIQDRAFFEDGEHRTLSLHPAQDPRTLRYWAKACRVAGVKTL